MQRMTDRQRVQEAISRFPTYFSLRAFPDKVFRIGERESYVNDDGVIKLYTQVLTIHKHDFACSRQRPHTDGAVWLDFAKGTEDELAGQIAPIGEQWRETVKEIQQ